MADDYGDVYDRFQERFDLEDMDDDTIEGALLENFTNRKTKHSGIVDLTSPHKISEWKDHSRGELREKSVGGFTPRLRGAVEKIKVYRDRDVDKEIAKITKSFSIASVERGEAREILKDKEKQSEKWRKVRNDIDDLIRDNVEVPRQELERQEKIERELTKQRLLEARAAERRAEREAEKAEREAKRFADLEEARALAKQIREANLAREYLSARQELAETGRGRQTLAGFKTQEKRKTSMAARSIFDLEL